MKNRILILAVVLMAAIAGAAQKTKVFENPVYESANTSTIEITRIETGKEATVVSATIWYRHNYWVRLLGSCVLKGRTTGREYKMLRVEGIETDKEVWMPASERIDFKMFFEPLGSEEKTVDFLEGPSDTNPWKIEGISLEPQSIDLQGSWQEAGNAGNVLAAFVKDRLLYDGEIWRYTATKKGKNITLDITRGGTSRQLFAVQKSDGNLLLKKDKKDKGVLLTRKAQTVTEDAYTFNPKRATPLFFRAGKVVLKGCYINNRSDKEPQKFLKILKYNNVLSYTNNELVDIKRDGTFEAEFEIDHPHYVFLLEPFNSMVFLTPGDTLTFCIDAVEENRRHYTGYTPAVLGNTLSAQLTRNTISCGKLIEKSIDGVKEACTYDKKHSATKESALAFVEKVAPLFKEIYEQAPALLAGLPLSTVAKDIIVTNTVEELFTNILDVAMRYSDNSYVQVDENVYEPNKDYIPLTKTNYYTFLKDSVNFQNILDNNYLFCNNNNWLVFNRFTFEIPYIYRSRIYNADVNNFDKRDFIKELAARFENKDFEHALEYFKYGKHYTGNFHSKTAEIAAEIPFDSIPSRNYIYRKAFKDIQEELGVGNCMLIQQSIMEASGCDERINLDETLEDVASVMPFITNPVVAGQLMNYLRKIIAKQEGGAGAKSMRPEVAEFLSSLTKKYPGEVIILDFWGLGCGPCRAAMLRHRELVEEFAGKVRFVYICDLNNPTDAVNEFFTTNNIKGENLRVSEDVWALLSSHFNFSGVPHIEILQPDGSLLDNSDRVSLDKFYIENVLLKK